MLSASVLSRLNAVVQAAALCAVAACSAKPPQVHADAAVVRAPDTRPLVPSNLEGAVTDSANTPLPDVLVIAWPKDKRGEAIAQARTDEEGHFILPGLRPDRWRLLVEAGGLGTLETERQVPEDGPATLMLEGRSRTLTGVVADGAGRPQSGAVVELGSAGLRWPRTARSDANGIFFVAGLGSGRFTLRARLAERVSQTSVVTLDEATLRAPHVRLSLQPGVLVEGRVLDDSGRILAGASVDVMAMPSDDLPVSGLSGRDGRFRVGPVAPGKYQILARIEDYVPLDAPEPQLGARPVQSFDLRLARTAKVAGRVVDEGGQAMAGVLVSAISLIGGHDDLVVVPGALPLAAEAAELPIANLLRQGGVRSGATDRTGRFVITGLAPGRTRLEVRHASKLPFRREPLLIAPGDDRELGDLVLLAGATVAGKVVDGDTPVEGALVEARLSGNRGRPAVRATTDAKGEFFVRLPLGEYLLNAQTEKMVSAQPLAVSLRSDVTPESCTLPLAPRPGRAAVVGATSGKP
jgi:protocatechuate 3,4-dioxygenase beta subunit